MSETTVAMRKLEAERVARRVCRHCGGKVPCWSPYGDHAPGKKHTRKTFEKEV